jgi:DNA polymerase
VSKVRHVLHRDIESRSTLDLTDVGAWRYAGEATTGVWCIGFVADGAPARIWIPGQPIPEEFHVAARESDWLIVAHNDAFERAIEERILAPRYGWPIVPIERHRDTMAMALASALPAKLETVAEVLRLPVQKDAAGARLMRQMTRPRKPRAGEDPNGIYWYDDPEKLERLYAYCRQDVEVERELSHRLLPLIDSEQALWALDAVINGRGFYTDGALLEAASKIAVTAGDAVQAELTRITAGALTSTDQVAAMLAWLGEHGCEIKDLRKPTLGHALRCKDLDPIVRRVIELRLGAAHAAAAKIDTLLDWRDADGRVRGTLRYHGAGTGRWTGHGPQPQNFKRDSDGIEAKVAAIATGDLVYVQKLYPQPLEVVGDIARAMIRAAPGRRLLIGDFSGIESRVLAWVSGQQSKLDQWAKFDRTGDPKDEPYYLLGRSCGQPEESARKIGKTADLAFGYMGGPGAWDRLAPEDDSSSEADKRRYQQTWRSLHPATVQFWYGIDRAAIAAINKPGPNSTYKRFTLAYDGTFLRILLPSGRALSYPFPRLETGKFGHLMATFKDNAAGKWIDCRYGQGAYGGLWTENVVQAVSRDLLAAAMQRLEAAGYPIVLHVHDEIVAEAPIEFGSMEEFQRVITTLPDWAEGLPIAAKVRNGQRFAKSEKPVAAPDAFDEARGDILDDLLDGDAKFAGSADSGESEITHHGPFVAVEAESDHHAAVEKSENLGGPEDLATAANEPGAGTKANGSGAQRAGNYPHGERRSGRHVATYLYRDHLGGNHTKVQKWRSPKMKRAQYPQNFWVNGRWVSEKPKGWVKVPYHLPEMLAALAKDPSVDVFVPEGEKDTDTIAALGLIATNNSEGATPLKAKTGKWAPELNKWFSGIRRLFILADNDEVGRAFAREKARALAGIVPDIRIVSFPDVPEGEDVTWWLEHNHTKEELIAHCESAPRCDGELESVCASSIEIEAYDWLWPDRFAIGEIGLIVGMPDEGKGQTLNYIAASVTRGLDWPNNEGRAPQGDVILLTAEDDVKKTVVPRLKAAGADLNRIEIVKMMHERDPKDGKQIKRMFSLITDLGRLREKIIARGNVKLVEIDPVSAYLGLGKVDSYRTSDVRAVLGPLKDLAEELAVAIIGIMHFNKKVDVTNVLLRVSDSLAFVAAPRHVFGVIDDPDNGRKLVVRAKNNLAEANQKKKSLAFHFDVKQVGTDPRNDKPIQAPFIVWEPGYVDVTATEALSAVNQNKAPGALNDAKEFLRDILVAGDGRAPKADIEEAADAEKIAVITLRRAKKALKIRAEKDHAPEGKWYWVLPDDDDEGDQPG